MINQDEDPRSSYIDSIRHRRLFYYKKLTDLSLNVDKHNPVLLPLYRETSTMYSQIRDSRNRDLQSMVCNNAAGRTIDCTWCCDVSISSNAAVNFSIISMN